MKEGSGAVSSRARFHGVKVVVVVLALGFFTYIVGPPLYWQIREGLFALRHSSSSSSCPPCLCDCPPDSANNNNNIDGSAAFSISGFDNNSFTDCDKVDPVMGSELNKTSIELLTEELKLQEVVTVEGQQRADSALTEAKKVSSQYQKEAEKCNMAMETCEEGGEKIQAALRAQRKLSALWEQRARERGWQGKETEKKIEQRKLMSRMQEE